MTFFPHIQRFIAAVKLIYDAWRFRQRHESIPERSPTAKNSMKTHHHSTLCEMKWFARFLCRFKRRKQCRRAHLLASNLAPYKPIRRRKHSNDSIFIYYNYGLRHGFSLPTPAERGRAGGEKTKLAAIARVTLTEPRKRELIMFIGLPPTI